jgi:hypothetical protein
MLTLVKLVSFFLFLFILVVRSHEIRIRSYCEALDGGSKAW